MIVQTAEQVRRILPSYNFKVGPTRIDDFIARAQEWVSDNIIGASLEQTLEEPTVEKDGLVIDNHSKLRLLVSRVICEQAYAIAASEMDLQLSEAGFVVQNNEKMSPASQQRTERLLKSLGERLSDDCDALVKYLLKESRDEAAYEDWRGTEQFAYLTQAFMPTMKTVRQNTGQTVANSWQEFIDLQPRLSVSMKTTVAEYVSLEQVETLLENYRDNILLDSQRKAIRLMRMAALADVAGMEDNAVHFAVEARSIMCQHKEDFHEFVNSDRFNMPEVDFGSGAVANLL